MRAYIHVTETGESTLIVAVQGYVNRPRKGDRFYDEATLSLLRQANGTAGLYRARIVEDGYHADASLGALVTRGAEWEATRLDKLVAKAETTRPAHTLSPGIQGYQGRADASRHAQLARHGETVALAAALRAIVN